MSQFGQSSVTSPPYARQRRPETNVLDMPSQSIRPPAHGASNKAQSTRK